MVPKLDLKGDASPSDVEQSQLPTVRTALPQCHFFVTVPAPDQSVKPVPYKDRGVAATIRSAREMVAASDKKPQRKIAWGEEAPRPMNPSNPSKHSVFNCVTPLSPGDEVFVALPKKRTSASF